MRLGNRYYVDGGLRMNTPLSPALRLGCERVRGIGLKHPVGPDEDQPAYPEDVIGKPAFLLGKVLNALVMDRLEYELQRMELVNAQIERGEKSYGDGSLESFNFAVHAQRGADHRRVSALTLRPSQDIGALAAECYARQGTRSMCLLLSRFRNLAQLGAPEGQADLLSYLFFDRRFTSQLKELGREDARAQSDEILALLRQ